MLRLWFKRAGLAGLVGAALFGIASAGVLIEQLGAAATPADTDLVPTVQGTSPAKGQTLGAIAAYMAARSETLTNKTINCVSGNTCTLPGGGGGTSWSVQAIRTGSQTLVGTDAGTIIPDTGAITWTLPSNSGGGVFAPGKQFILQNLGTDLQSLAATGTGALYGIPTVGSTSITGWIPSGSAVLITIDAGGNYFASYLSSPIGTQHTSSGTSDTLNASSCLDTVFKTASTAITETVPTGLPVGCHAEFIQGGAGAITIQAGSGFTLTSPHSYTHSFAQGSIIGVAITTSTTGIFYGDGA